MGDKEFLNLVTHQDLLCEERNLGHRIKFFGSAGNGKTELQFPFGLAVDRSDNIYISDAGNGRVQVYHRSGYYLRSIGESGRDKGELFCPRDVAVTELGKVYVADSGNHRVQVYDSCGNFVCIIGRQGIASVLLGNKGSNQGVFDTPSGVALSPDDSYVVITDRGNHRVQVFTADGQFSHMFGMYGTGPGQFEEPWGVTVTPDEYIVVADSRNHRLQVFTMDGDYVRSIEGDGENTLDTPSGIACSSDGSYIGVTDTGNNRVAVFTLMGEFVDSYCGNEGHPSLGLPRGVTIDSMSRVIVTDTANCSIQCLYWKA